MSNNNNEKRLPVGKDISARRREARVRRHVRVRKTLRGTPEAPRLAVFLAAASSVEKVVAAVEGDKKAKAAKVGQLIAERAKAAGIEKVVFDRGGYKYHGRVAALADAAREGGLKF